MKLQAMPSHVPDALPRLHAAEVDSVSRLADDDRPAEVFALFIENPITNYTSVRTYATRFDRGLAVIMLSAQPLILKIVDF